MRKNLFIALMALALPTVVAAQTQTEKPETPEKAEKPESPERPDAASHKLTIDAVLEHASELGLESSLLDNKIAEGRAKGMTDAQIARALEVRLDALARAQRRFEKKGTPVSAAQLARAVDAFEAGVSLHGNAHGGIGKDVSNAAKAKHRTAAEAAASATVNAAAEVLGGAHGKGAVNGKAKGKKN